MDQCQRCNLLRVHNVLMDETRYLSPLQLTKTYDDVDDDPNINNTKEN